MNPVPLLCTLLISCTLPKLQTGQVCGLQPYPTSTCETCMDTLCCEEAAACEQDAGCSALQQCLAGCTTEDHLCLAACAREHPATDVSAALSQCRTSSCADSCATCTSTHRKEFPACDDCMRETCCELSTQCTDDPACAEVMACVASCTVPGCRDVCLLTDAATYELYDAVSDCERDGCAEQGCAWGQNWACVRNHQPLPSTASTARATLRLMNSTGFLPEPGVRVLACSMSDPDCSQPLTQARTDDAGEVVLELDVSVRAFDGFLKIDRDDLITTHLRLGRPIVGHFVFRTSVFTPSRVEALAEELGVEVDPTKGAVSFIGLDCDDTSAAGVQFDILGTAEHVRYFNGFSLSKEDASSINSPAVAVNVEPGLHEVVMRRDGEVLGQTTIHVLEGVQTSVGLYPLSSAP